MANINVVSIAPRQLDPSSLGGLYDLERFEKKYLAQGDSWFSIGHMPPWSTTNVLQQMVLSRSAVAVNCAHPGMELSHMADTSTEPAFLNLLNGSGNPNLAWKWDAILMSGGGNDLIDAAQANPQGELGARLLLREDEWPANGGVEGYLSQPGWQTFSDHLDLVLFNLLEERDRNVNQSVPLLLHTYDYVTVRNAPAGPGLGPWLYKAMNGIYRIPATDWDTLSDVLIRMLQTLMRSLGQKYAARNVIVVDTVGTLTRADPGTSGVSGDWENEIHPTPHGYSLLAQQWRGPVDALA
jgi:hypothetical protein